MPSPALQFLPNRIQSASGDSRIAGEILAIRGALVNQQTAQIIEEETARLNGHKLRRIRLVVTILTERYLAAISLAVGGGFDLWSGH
jgi:hypothetical protein